MFEKYQKRIRFFMHNPIWAFYLKWAYKICIKDLEKTGFKPNFFKKDFTALLCGTAGSTTSKTFATYVFSKNPKTKLIILDLGEKQIGDSKKVLSSLFPEKDIQYLCEDALNTSIVEKSIDYIETDGLFEFFSYSDLKIILKEWHRILKDDGFIAFRAYVNYSLFTRFFDKLKISVGNKILSITAYAHTKNKLTNILNESKFNWFNEGGTFLPGFQRFVLYKSIE